MKRISYSGISTCIAAILLFNSTTLWSAELAIENAWVAEAPPGAMALAGFMTLKNTANKEVALIGASSDIADTVEIHKTLFKAGVASMEEQKRVEIQAGESLTMEPGGMHVMFMGPKKPLKAGDKLSLFLEMEDGTKQEISMQVKKRQ